MVPRSNAGMVVKFLRAHATYLDTGAVAWPYVNSARAISETSLEAARLLENAGVVDWAERIAELETIMHGMTKRWREHGAAGFDEFIERAEKALDS